MASSDLPKPTAVVSFISQLLQPAMLQAMPFPFLPQLPTQFIQTAQQPAYPTHSLLSSHTALVNAKILADVPPEKRLKIETESSGSGSCQSVSPQFSSPSRKHAKPIPEERKDAAYFERRRKNNDAAKRSRDLRRLNEEAVAAKAATLAAENQELRAQVTLLKTEIAKLHLVLIAQSKTSISNSSSS